MDMFDYGYEPNEIESDMFLSEIPVSLMKENIKAQFNDPLEHRKKDHLTTFLNMYHYSKENADAYEDEDMDNIVELRDEFYAFMQQIFREYLGIGFVNFDDMSEEKQDKLIHYTYRFFLMNIKKNFVCFIINYIEEHRDELGIDDEKKKDVTTLALKKEITDPKDVAILSELGNIINDILASDIDIDEFLDKCDDDATLETSIVKKAFDDMEITGNFIDNYINMVDDDFRSEIESKIRNKILKKYKKRSVVDVEEE
jgi:hypothetical protein